MISLQGVHPTILIINVINGTYITCITGITTPTSRVKLITPELLTNGICRPFIGALYVHWPLPGYGPSHKQVRGPRPKREREREKGEFRGGRQEIARRCCDIVV